jgi:hypothetical protein
MQQSHPDLNLRKGRTVTQSCIIATAKDEAPFLVEWLAHHLALGFDKILVATNDCTDGTDALLDAIGTAFPVYRVENPDVLPG